MVGQGGPKGRASWWWAGIRWCLVGLVGLVPAVEAFRGPFEGTAVFAVVRRHEVAVFIAATEVEDDRILLSVKRYTRCSISFATLERDKGRVFIWR